MTNKKQSYLEEELSDTRQLYYKVIEQRNNALKRVKELEEALRFYMGHADCRNTTGIGPCRCSFCKNEDKHRQALGGGGSK